MQQREILLGLLTLDIFKKPSSISPLLHPMKTAVYNKDFGLL